jgi:hypothetical protein
MIDMHGITGVLAIKPLMVYYPYMPPFVGNAATVSSVSQSGRQAQPDLVVVKRPDHRGIVDRYRRPVGTPTCR